MAEKFDPIQTAIIDKRLANITTEMAITLMRTTSSTYLQARDLCTGILDARGEALGQTEYLQLLMYSLVPQLKSVIAFFGDDIHPGDMFLHNDPFSGGNQLQDVACFRPVFWEGELVFWTAAKGHVSDLGGPVLGGFNPTAQEVWEETIRIPALKLWERGQPRKDIWEMLMANTRMPEFLGRDFKAMAGGCEVGERLLHEQIQRYGLQSFQGQLNDLMDASEEWMRREIEKMPDGEYYGESVTEFNGEHTARLTIRVKGSEIEFDFSGTDEQVEGYINGIYATTHAAVLAIAFMLVDPLMPHNSGSTRPIRIQVPTGTFLNANYPAATVRGNITCNDVVPDCIIRALEQAVPERMFGAWRRSFSPLMGGIDPRTQRPYQSASFLNFGGAGGAEGADGWSNIGMITASGISVPDYEIQELLSPLVILKHEFREDSAGPGRWRGGFGMHTRFRTYADPAVAVNCGTAGHQPFGILGGKPGAPSSIRFELPDGSTIEGGSNAIYELPTDTVVDILGPGGGGYGLPWERPPADVLADAQAGRTSLEAARGEYGVALDPETLAIDEEETQQLRSNHSSDDAAV